MPSYDLETYTLPIWESDIVYYETVLFVGEEDCAQLLYPIEEVIGVYNYGLDIEYIKDVDFEILDGKIKRLKNGNLPYCPINDYYLETPAQHPISIVNNRENAPKGKKFLNFGEEDTFTKYQIAITYRHLNNNKRLIPITKKDRFKIFTDKIKNGNASIIFYGDSITTGCNSSGTPMGGMVKPMAESYPIMVCKKIQNIFGTNINYVNTAVGGWSTLQGVNAFNERVLNAKYDLLVLAFGMNDSATEPKIYRERIEKMILGFKEKNPEGEILLVSTMYPNTESDWVKNQPILVKELYILEQKYSFVAVADITKIHFEILESGKRYRDMTGNNVNHPNDFLARVYAQVVLKTILG